LSDRVVDALETFLVNPKTCPHGHPIPDKQGNIVLTEAPRLSEFAEGTTVIVERVSEESSEVLCYLEEMKVFPGEEISITKVAPFEGPLLVDIGGESIPMSREIASKVWAVEKS